MTTKVFNVRPCDLPSYGGLGGVSAGYPPVTGVSLTRYAPFRRSPASIAGPAAPRLACVKPAASVHPEPGSNSSLYIHYITLSPIPTDSLLKKSTLSIQNYSRYLLVLSFNIFKDLAIFENPNPLAPPAGGTISAFRRAGDAGLSEGIFKERGASIRSGLQR